MNTLFVWLLSAMLFLNIDLPSIRKQFEKSENSQESTLELYSVLKGYKKSDPTLLAYKGASSALYARYQKDSKLKKSLFVSGVKELEAAIKTDPDNVEIRLIRLIIQENTPKLLKYKMNMTEDKQMILANFDSQQKVVKEAIKRYAVQRSKLFTAADLRKISG